MLARRAHAPLHCARCARARGPRPSPAPGRRPRRVIRVARRVAAGEAPPARHAAEVDGIGHAGGPWAAHSQHDR
eukprot:1452600-Prymnesium_polylepis.1